MTLGLIKETKTIFWDFDGVIKESVEVKSDVYESLFLPFGDNIANKVRKELQWSDSKSYDIASHGLTHTRPLTLSLSDFINEIKRSKLILEEIIQKKIISLIFIFYS